jgi:hypothetical protein
MAPRSRRFRMILSRFGFACFLVATIMTTGCSRDYDEYTVTVSTRGHTVYKISRPGGLVREENFDVMLVYGFNDNRIVGQQIVGFLNQEEPDTYFLTEVTP